MIKAAFDEAKINKQAGNRAGLYLRQDDGGGAGMARPSPTSNGGAAPRARGPRPPPLLRRVFPGPGKVSVAVPNSRVPAHAGGGFWGEREAPRAAAASERGGRGAHFGGADWHAGAVPRLRSRRSHVTPAPAMLRWGPCVGWWAKLWAGRVKPEPARAHGWVTWAEPGGQACAHAPGPYRPAGRTDLPALPSFHQIKTHWSNRAGCRPRGGGTPLPASARRVPSSASCKGGARGGFAPCRIWVSKRVMNPPCANPNLGQGRGRGRGRG